MSAPALPEQRVRNERLRLRLQAIRTFARRFASRPDGVIGVVVLLIFTVLAIAPDLFVGPLQTATNATGPSLSPPTAANLLGTDELGRDILNLTIHGTRISMVIGFLATIVTIFLGALVGIVSGYVGGRLAKRRAKDRIACRRRRSRSLRTLCSGMAGALMSGPAGRAGHRSGRRRGWPARPRCSGAGRSPAGPGSHGPRAR